MPFCEDYDFFGHATNANIMPSITRAIITRSMIFFWNKKLK